MTIMSIIIKYTNKGEMNMKKIILTIMVTLGVAAIAGGLMFNKINEEHRAEIDELKADHQIRVKALTNQYDHVVEDYEDMIGELNRTQDEMNDLYEQVYNMQNGEAYKVRIEHDGKTHYWESDNEGIFKSVSHTVIY